MRTMRCAVAALVVAGLAGGCSGTEQDVPRVASIQSFSPPVTQAAAGGNQRPLIPVDATDEERDAFRDRWMDCVREKGGPAYQDPRDLTHPRKSNDPKAAEIRAACLPLEPETYEDRQKRTDIAAFRDNQRQWAQCAERAGYKLTSPDENGEFGITEVGPNGDFQSPRMQNCRKVAFKD